MCLSVFDKNFSLLLFCFIGSYSDAVAVNRKRSIVFFPSTERYWAASYITLDFRFRALNRADVELVFLIIFASVDGNSGKQMKIWLKYFRDWKTQVITAMTEKVFELRVASPVAFVASKEFVTQIYGQNVSQKSLSVSAFWLCEFKYIRNFRNI